MDPAAEDEPNPELADMTRRFWIAAALAAAAAVILAMGGHVGVRSRRYARRVWLQLALASPVVLWGGWPFFLRGWESLADRHLNMFTLIALGTGVAYCLQRWSRRSRPAYFPPRSAAPTAPCRSISRRRR